jgi:MFS family permease
MMALERRLLAICSIRGDAASVIGPDQPAHQLIRAPNVDPAAARDRVAPYAWVVVAVVAITLTIASGARFLFGVVLKPISEEFGWNRAQLTGAVMLAMVVLSICQPLVGILVDRIGAKKILVGGIALLGVSLIPLSFATSLWQIYVLYGVLTSFGLAAASPVLATSIVGRWFTHNRGLAMSVATSGSAFGQLLIVPIATWIMLATSWQTTYRVLAVALLAVAVPLSAIFLRDAPRAEVAVGEAPPPEEGLTLRDAIAHPAFWIMAFGFVVCGWTMAFPNTHFLAYADDMGMSVLHAANTSPSPRSSVFWAASCSAWPRIATGARRCWHSPMRSVAWRSCSCSCCQPGIFSTSMVSSSASLGRLRPHSPPLSPQTAMARSISVLFSDPSSPS